ncbi:MAG TPA: 50S ribosomal protein L25 [Baekduia sp.]|nr:50S ribosomal protein L25 [Baekduia sp.]
MAADNTKLEVQAREAAHSREIRRLRRDGQVPGVLYGGGDEPVPFAVAERALRHALAAEGAVLELSVDGGAATPAVVKETQRHPVRGDLTHVDFLRVDLSKPIQASVVVEFEGADKAPGVREGGILEHVTREVTVEALPTDIPESVLLDVSEMQIGDTISLTAIQVPAGVTLIDDEDTTIASVHAPRVSASEEVESETEVVGEGEAPADSGGDDAAGDDE